MTKILKDHFCPKPSSIVQRSKFYGRVRRSVTNFLAELRKLTEHCKFGDSLDRMLCDHLICGINDAPMQRKLLSEGDNLSLAEALKLALSMEVAYKDSQELPQAEQLPWIKEETIHQLHHGGQHSCGSAPPKSGGQQASGKATSHGKKCYRCLGEVTTLTTADTETRDAFIARKWDTPR